MRRVGPTRRLFALLLDPEVVETQEAGELHADLAVLGVDPADAIAMAKRLAECAPSPAVTLLARLAESDRSVDDGQSTSPEAHPIPQEGMMDLAAKELSSRSASPYRFGRTRPPRVSRRWIYGLGAAAASLAMVTSLNLISPVGCYWPFSLFHPSRECGPLAISNGPALVALSIVDSGRVPVALRNVDLRHADLPEVLDEALAAAAGRQIVALFSVRHPDGTLSDSALLVKALPAGIGWSGPSEVTFAETPEGLLAELERQRDELSRRLGDKDNKVIGLQREIEALRRHIRSTDNSTVSPGNLEALEEITGSLPDDLVVIDLPPRSN